MIFEVTLSPGDVDRQLDHKARTADRHVRDGLEELGERGESVMLGMAPHGPTDHFADRITHDVEGSGFSALVRIGSKAPHAHLVNKGRRPGRMAPPVLIAHLLGLDRRAGFATARAIGRKGTEGTDIYERTRDALRGDVDRVSKRVLERIGDLHR